MHHSSHFTETRREVLDQLIRRHPLGTLVTLAGGSPVADHVPFVLDSGVGEMGRLRGHVARANPVWRGRKDESESLIVFHGPQAYISPTWYATKRETGKVVPTWNYVVVHVYGFLRVIQDAEWLHTQLNDLTTQQESGRPEPWSVSDAPEDFTQRLLPGIVGLQFDITRILGKSKLSQNQPENNRHSVLEGLRSEFNDRLVHIMRRTSD